MRCAGGNVGGEMVALLRVVNLGARNKVPMAQLRTLLEDAGYDGVRTYIASGNVILDGPKSRTAVAAVVAGHPFRRRHIWLARRVPRRAARAGRERTARCPRLSPDRAVLAGADVYLHYPAALGCATRAAARRAWNAPQLADCGEAGRARLRGVGSGRHRSKGGLQWHWHGSFRSKVSALTGWRS